MVMTMGNVGRIVMVVLVCAATLSQQHLIKLHKEKRSTSGGSTVATCTDEYVNITDHTMCKPDDPRVEQSGVSAADRQIILDIHNANRSKVEPPATDLAPLIWNDKVAAVAQKFAQMCPSGHDKVRWVPSLGMSVGQNLAFGTANWAEAVKLWSAEVKDFTYGKELPYEEFKKVGHYTQVVHKAAFMIGCGYARCRDTKYGHHYVCNYAAGQSNPKTPYTKGTRCADCTTKCKDGLCNCNGLVCLNGGTIDLNTCSCKCLATYKGNDCGELNCEENEPSYCNDGQITIDCANAFYFARCAFKCGRCAPRAVYTSPSGCQHSGKRYSLEECKAFGNNGNDISNCESKGGSWGCEDCKKYSNIPTVYCPVMCGICDPQP